MEFWPDWFYVHDLKKGKEIFVGGFLNPKDSLYKLCEMNQLDRNRQLLFLTLMSEIELGMNDSNT
jgi:hypothetical protein